MSDLVGLVLTFGVLVGSLLLIVGGARSGRGAARTLRGFRYYTLKRAWAHAVLAALALGQIAAKVGGPGAAFVVLGLLVGGVCAWFAEPNRMVELGLGAIGGVAGVIGSFAYVSGARDPVDVAIRVGVVIALGSVFGIFGLLRFQPLNGLTWFAALSIVVFLASPGGASIAEIGGISGVAAVLLGIGGVIAMALAPSIAIRLGAIGVSIVKLLGPALGYFPAATADPLPVVAATLAAYVVVRLVGRRAGR